MIQGVHFDPYQLLLPATLSPKKTSQENANGNYKIRFEKSVNNRIHKGIDRHGEQRNSWHKIGNYIRTAEHPLGSCHVNNRQPTEKKNC